MTDKVLFAEGEDGILLLPYDEDKSKQPEYLEGRFGSSDRVVLPRQLTLKYGIEKAVSVKINRDGTILLKPLNATCMVCGSTEHLMAVGNKTNTYICKRCCRTK